MIEISKTVLGAAALSLLDGGHGRTRRWPFNSPAYAPEKFVREVTKTFLPYFEGRNISSLRFGKRMHIKQIECL